MRYVRFFFMVSAASLLLAGFFDIKFLKNLSDSVDYKLPSGWRDLVKKYDGNHTSLEAEFIRINRARARVSQSDQDIDNIGSGLVFTDDGGVALEVEYGFEYYFFDLKTGCWSFMQDNLYFGILVPRAIGLNWFPGICK